MIILRILIFVALLGASEVSSAQSVRYIHTDALGSPVAITNSSGQVMERREYEPYGAQLPPGLSDGPGYTGHVQDASTGLTYMEQRYYDPMLGKFLSVDPVTADGNTGGNFNRYWYANNNPYKFIDPDGRYNCAKDGGTCSVEDSARVEGYVQTMRDVHSSMKPGAASERVGEILGAIGNAWDGNGVTIDITDLGDALGEQVGKTLRIDENSINALARENGQQGAAMALVGSVILHEGSHMIDSQRPGFKGNVYPTSGAERMLTEVRAYGVNSAVHNVLGISSRVNSQGMSVEDRASAILNAAKSSYESACVNGGWGC